MSSNDHKHLYKQVNKTPPILIRQVSSSTSDDTTITNLEELVNNETSNEYVYESNTRYKIQYIVSVIATLALFGSGMHIGWVGPTLLKLMSNGTQIPITGTEASWLAGSLPLGGVFGPILGSFLADYYGRKIAILIIAIPSLITWTIISLANNVYLLCLAQFIGGLNVSAGFTVLPMYIGEIASPKIRGTLGTFVTVQFYIGFLVESIIVPYISMVQNSMIASIVPIFLICTFIWMPETPYYYLMKNQTENAAKSLRTFMQSDFIEDQLNRIKIAIDIQRNEKLNCRQLFKKRTNRISFSIVIGILTVQEFCGLAAILLYAQVIFEQAQTPIDANLGGIILSAMGVVFLFGSTIFVDIWGRRPLLILSSLITAIPLIMIGIYFHLKALNYEHISSFSLVPIIALILFKFTFGIGIGPLPAVCASEMFETNFKAWGSCLMCCYGSLTGFIVAKLFQLISDVFGVYSSFYFFAIWCLCGAIFFYFVLPETKGRTLEEIQQNLNVQTETNDRNIIL